MSSPCSSACSQWASIDELCEPCNSYGWDPVVLDRMIAVATDLLYELSGRRFPGACLGVVRPCARRSPSLPKLGHEVSVEGWTWNRAWGYCGCNRSRQCGCTRLSEVTLGGYPVVAIGEVLVDGVALDPSLYRVDDHRYLVRLPDPDGSNPGWPCCSRIDLPVTEPDTWQVTYTYGVEPPSAGVHAAARLACELALACSPETISRCRLPRRVREIVRQGVSMTLIDPFDFFEERRTGLYEVDLFLAAYNPNGRMRRGGVLSPDIGRRVRRAGT